MKILITGGLGNIGSTLAIGAPADWCVTTIDRAADRDVVRDAIRSRGPGNFVIEEDLKNVTKRKLPYSPNFLIHCAAEVDPQRSGSSARAYNMKLTEAALALAQNLNSHLVFVSTTSVYERTEILMPAQQVTGGLTEYSKGKLDEERLIESNSSRHTILRLGSVFGLSAQTNWRTAVNKMVAGAAESGEVRLWRKSVNSVSPHASVKALPQVMKALLSGPEMHGRNLDYVTMNISLAQIAAQICQVNPGTRVILEEHANASESHLFVSPSQCFSDLQVISDLETELKEMFTDLGAAAEE